jgi:hypothetical protein
VKKLGTPSAIAMAALALGLAASPDLALVMRYRAASGVLAGLTALFVIAVADRRAPGRLVALGAATATLALGYDAVRGERGQMTLGPGEGATAFMELGPGGRELGLHPLGTAVALEAIEPDGTAVLLERSDRRVRISRRRAETIGGYRVGAPRLVATGAARVVLHISGGGEGELSLREGESGRAAGLEITVERYFPDFALDEQQKPFSRSEEPRNPAALLQVRKEASSWRVFVIRALPGLHHPEGLDRTITLAEVVTEQAVRMAVSREPAALLAGLGLLVAAGGVAWSRW